MNNGNSVDNGKPWISDEDIIEVWLLFENSPPLITGQAESFLNISISTLYRILLRCIFLHLWKMQNFQKNRFSGTVTFRPKGRAFGGNEAEIRTNYGFSRAIVLLDSQQSRISKYPWT